MTAQTYFEFVERKPALDVIPWEVPKPRAVMTYTVTATAPDGTEEVTEFSQLLEPDQYEAILRQLEALNFEEASHESA
jgi:hypothetical protein